MIIPITSNQMAIILFLLFILIVGIFLLIFKDSFKSFDTQLAEKLNKFMQNQKRNQDVDMPDVVLPSCILQKTWRVDDAIVGELNLQCVAETSEKSQEGIIRLLNISKLHDDLCKKESKTKKKTGVEIG